MDFAIVSQSQPLEIEMPYKRQRTTYEPKQAKAASTIQRVYRKAKKTTFERNVKRIISSLAETKCAFHNSGDSLTKFNSGINATGDLLQVVPNIAQGTGDSNRIGAQIRAKSLRIKGFVKLDVNDVDDSTKLPAVLVRMMVVSMKPAPSYQDAITLASKVGTLLKKGATTVAFTGVLGDINADINTDVFTVHHDQKFYLNQSYINAVGATPPSTRIAQDVSNTVKFFDINVRCKDRLLRYDEDVGSNVLPGNFGPFMLLGYSYLDGSTPDVLDTKVGLQYESMLKFEDA